VQGDSTGADDVRVVSPRSSEHHLGVIDPAHEAVRGAGRRLADGDAGPEANLEDSVGSGHIE